MHTVINSMKYAETAVVIACYQRRNARLRFYGTVYKRAGAANYTKLHRLYWDYIGKNIKIGGATRLKKELLQLPVDNDGLPDWKYI